MRLLPLVPLLAPHALRYPCTHMSTPSTIEAPAVDTDEKVDYVALGVAARAKWAGAAARATRESKSEVQSPPPATSAASVKSGSVVTLADLERHPLFKRWAGGREVCHGPLPSLQADRAPVRRAGF